MDSGGFYKEVSPSSSSTVDAWQKSRHYGHVGSDAPSEFPFVFPETILPLFNHVRSL